MFVQLQERTLELHAEGRGAARRAGARARARADDAAQAVRGRGARAPDGADGRDRSPQGRVPRDPRARAAQPARSRCRPRSRCMRARSRRAGARARARHHPAPGPSHRRGSSTICSTSRGSQTGKLELRREPIVARRRSSTRRSATCARPIDARKHTLEVARRRRPRRSSTAIRCASSRSSSNLLSNAIKYTDARRHDRRSTGASTATTRSSASPTTAAASRRAVADDLRHVRAGARRRPTAPAASASASASSSGSSSCTAARVHAASDGPGKGATFEIRLAARRRRSARADEPRRTHDRAAAAAAARGRRRRRAGPARARRRSAAHAGHEVTVVEDGPSAVALICAETPDVALIDIGLPDMDGYEVARQLRRELDRPPAAPDRDDRLRPGQPIARPRSQAGFDAHIVKPASADKIMRALYGKHRGTHEHLRRPPKNATATANGNGTNGTQRQHASRPTGPSSSTTASCSRRCARSGAATSTSSCARTSTGVDGQIAETFNELVEMVKHDQGRGAATSRSAVGKEGQARQAHAPARRDRRLGRVHHRRSTSVIEDLTGHANEIARVVTAVARGDLEQTMEVEDGGDGPRRGEFLRHARIVNGMVARLVAVRLRGDARRARGRRRRQARRAGARPRRVAACGRTSPTP